MVSIAGEFLAGPFAAALAHFQSVTSVRSLCPFVLAADRNQPLLERLDPVRRAQVMMALLALLLAAIAILATVVIGGRIVRRLAKRSTQPSRVTPQDDWARKPLHPQADDDADDDLSHESA